MDTTAAAIGVVFLTAGVLLTRFIKKGGLGHGVKMRKMQPFPASPKPPASSCTKSGETHSAPPRP